MKKFISSATLCCVFTLSFSQTVQYFITSDNDTTYCTEIDVGFNVQWFLDELSYTTVDGEHLEFKGKKNVPDVISFYIDSVALDRTPLKPDDDKYVRWDYRAVDGKLIVYNPGQSVNRDMDPSGIYRFYLKMPDGTFYKINSQSNMKKYIIPYLEECTEFKQQYKGDYSTDEEPFIEMIELYNSLCE